MRDASEAQLVNDRHVNARASSRVSRALSSSCQVGSAGEGTRELLERPAASVSSGDRDDERRRFVGGPSCGSSGSLTLSSELRRRVEMEPGDFD